MNRQKIILLSLIGVSFVVGFFFDPYHEKNIIRIDSRSDLNDIHDMLLDEMNRSGHYLYHYELGDLAMYDESVEVIPIDMMHPNSYPIKSPWDYERWKSNFFGENVNMNETDSDSVRYVHVKINSDEQATLIIQKGDWTYRDISP